MGVTYLFERSDGVLVSSDSSIGLSPPRYVSSLLRQLVYLISELSFLIQFLRYRTYLSFLLLSVCSITSLPTAQNPIASSSSSQRRYSMTLTI
jgi:hypothetical protein